MPWRHTRLKKINIIEKYRQAKMNDRECRQKISQQKIYIQFSQYSISPSRRPCVRARAVNNNVYRTSKAFCIFNITITAKRARSMASSSHNPCYMLLYMLHAGGFLSLLQRQGRP